MKITIYNNEYEFCQVLQQDYIDEYIPDNFQEFDCPIDSITPDHPFAFGWLESISQSKLSGLFYIINFTHIKYEKIWRIFWEMN